METSRDGFGPDGAAVDRDGFYLGAIYGEGCLLRFDSAERASRPLEGGLFSLEAPVPGLPSTLFDAAA